MSQAAPATTQCLTSGSKRELRVDFFRGCALLIILVDHVEEMNGVHFLQSWTFRSIGFSDMADAFVFLSGYAFGIAFSKRMDRDGFLGCFWRSLQRSARIYAGFFVTLIFMLLMGYSLQSVAPRLNYALHLDWPIIDQMVAALTMSNFPAGAMLRFYVLVLPYATIQLALLRRQPYIAWAIALQLYVASQCLPELDIKSFLPIHEGWYINPPAWQLLYFVGLAFGSKNLGMPRYRITRWFATALSIAILVASLLVMKSIEFSGVTLAQEAASNLRNWPELTEKMTLGPLRLIHFAAMAYVFSLLSVRFPRFTGNRLAAPVVLVGQHPLLMYCSGVIMSYASLAICQWSGTSASSMLMLHTDLMLVSVAIAAASQWQDRMTN